MIILGCKAAEAYDRGCFFFTRIVSPIVLKFRDIQEGLSFSPLVREFWDIQEGGFFHQNWFATVPKFWDIQEGVFFSPELVHDRTKIQCFLFKKMFPFQNVFQKVFFSKVFKCCFLFNNCFLFKMCFFFKRFQMLH